MLLFSVYCKEVNRIYINIVHFHRFIIPGFLKGLRSSFPKNKELFSTIVEIMHVTCTVLVEEMLSQYFLEWDFIVPVNLKLFST